MLITFNTNRDKDTLVGGKVKAGSALKKIKKPLDNFESLYVLENYGYVVGTSNDNAEILFTYSGAEAP